MLPAGNLDILQNLPLQKLRYSVTWSTDGSWSLAVTSKAMREIGLVCWVGDQAMLSTCTKHTVLAARSHMQAVWLCILTEGRQCAMCVCWQFSSPENKMHNSLVHAHLCCPALPSPPPAPLNTPSGFPLQGKKGQLAGREAWVGTQAVPLDNGVAFDCCQPLLPVPEYAPQQLKAVLRMYQRKADRPLACSDLRVVAAHAYDVAALRSGSKAALNLSREQWRLVSVGSAAKDRCFYCAGLTLAQNHDGCSWP